MFSLDNVLDDLWPQARPAPWQKKLLKKLFYEEEFQQFADRHRHLKGLDTVEQVLEYLNIRCAIPAHDLEQIPNMARWSLSPTTPPAPSTAWRSCMRYPACAAMSKWSPTACSPTLSP